MFLGHFDRRKLRNCPQIYAIVYDFLSDKMSDNMPDKMTAVLKYCKFLKFRLQLVLKLFNAKEICNHKKKVKLVCPAVSGQKKGCGYMPQPSQLFNANVNKRRSQDVGAWFCNSTPTPKSAVCRSLDT